MFCEVELQYIGCWYNVFQETSKTYENENLKMLELMDLKIEGVEEFMNNLSLWSKVSVKSSCYLLSKY